MKKFILILVAVVSIGFSVNAKIMVRFSSCITDESNKEQFELYPDGECTYTDTDGTKYDGQYTFEGWELKIRVKSRVYNSYETPKEKIIKGNVLLIENDDKSLRILELRIQKKTYFNCYDKKRRKVVQEPIMWDD